MNKPLYLGIFITMAITACVTNSDSDKIEQLQKENQELKQIVQKHDSLLNIQNQQKEEYRKQLNEFNEAIKRTFNQEGYSNYEFNYSDHFSVSSRMAGSPDETEQKLINYGYVERGRYLGKSVIEQDLYDLELTSKGRSMLLDAETNYYDNGSYSYRWQFKIGRGRFKEVIDFKLIDDSKAEVKFTCELIEITDIGKDVFKENDTVGETKEYSETFIKNGADWVPKEISSFNKGWYK